MYAIVDIETTGSYSAANGITEISIQVFDGKTVIERFETLEISLLSPRNLTYLSKMAVDALALDL